MQSVEMIQSGPEQQTDRSWLKTANYKEEHCKNTDSTSVGTATNGLYWLVVICGDKGLSYKGIKRRFRVIHLLFLVPDPPTSSGKVQL